jgi:hypothetical protein
MINGPWKIYYPGSLLLSEMMIIEKTITFALIFRVNKQTNHWLANIRMSMPKLSIF